MFCFKGRGSGFAIYIVELIKNINDPHTCVLSTSIGHVYNLESVVDTCVEGRGGPCALDVLHQHKVVLQSVEACVDCGLF